MPLLTLSAVIEEPTPVAPSMFWTYTATVSASPYPPSAVYVPGRHVNQKPNAGAIAGGVVGGIAVVAIAVVAIFWIKRRHPRKQVVEQVEQPALAPAMVQEQHLPAPRVSQAPRYSSHESFGEGARVVKGDKKGDEEFEEWNERDLKQNAKI
jgi:hypothetical protein